jgi:hypothetical protein
MLVSDSKKRIKMVDIITHPYFSNAVDLLPKAVVEYLDQINQKS